MIRHAISSQVRSPAAALFKSRVPRVRAQPLGHTRSPLLALRVAVALARLLFERWRRSVVLRLAEPLRGGSVALLRTPRSLLARSLPGRAFGTAGSPHAGRALDAGEGTVNLADSPSFRLPDNLRRGRPSALLCMPATAIQLRSWPTPSICTSAFR